MGPLHGREAELARLEELAASVREGAADVVVMEGAAGIGKSRLLAEACHRASKVGLLVAVASADELDQVTPWGPLLRAFGSSEPPVLASWELDSLRHLGDQRLSVIEQMRAALEKASKSGPLLVALDDLQWADAATLLALGSLPSALFSYPVAWILALRPVPASPVLGGLLERLDEAGAAHLHLDPLPIADAVALARDAGAAGTDADLEDRIAGADGNPFYILELLKADRRPEHTDFGGADGSEVPMVARTAVAKHLRSLSEDCRRLLQVASVLGREFSVSEVAAMTGQPTGRLLSAVEEAMRAEVVAEAPAGLAFRHDLLRQAVYEGLPVSVRLSLHRDAADALRRTGAPAVRVAGQLAIGAVPGDRQAIAAMQQAVTELTPTSPGAAADLALQVLDLAGEQDESRPQMVLSAVRALAAAGRSAEARTLGERYLADHRPPAAVEAALQLELRQAWVFGRFEPYSDVVTEHVLHDPAVDPGVAAALMALEQVPKMWDGRGEEADHALADVMQVVAERGLVSQVAVVAQLHVLSSLFRGRAEEALARAEAALEAARPLEGPHSSGTHEEMVVTALTACGQIEHALATMQAALAAAGAIGRAELIFRYRRLRAALLLCLGNLDDAHAEASAAVTMAAELGYPGRIALPLSVLVETDLRRAAVASADAAFARYAPVSSGVLPDLHWAAALIADVHRDATSAAQAIAPIRAQLEAGIFGFATTQYHRLPQLVHIARRAGDNETARAFALAATMLAGQNPHLDSLAAAAAYARALIDDDAGLLREAVERAAASEVLLLEAAAREDLGHALAAKSASSEASGQLEAAYDFYVRIGAHRDTARVRAALRSLGVRKRQGSVARPKHGWASLTPSELAVVERVAQGLTNREAASELFLSPDTVSTHLRHAFIKLGIRSRVELARLAAQRERTPGQTRR